MVDGDANKARWWRGPSSGREVGRSGQSPDMFQRGRQISWLRAEGWGWVSAGWVDLHFLKWGRQGKCAYSRAMAGIRSLLGPSTSERPN